MSEAPKKASESLERRPVVKDDVENLLRGTRRGNQEGGSYKATLRRFPDVTTPTGPQQAASAIASSYVKPPAVGVKEAS